MTNTIHNVPRELLRDIETHLDNIAEFDPSYAPDTVPLNTSAELLIPLRALLSTPSPAGVDGLEVVGYFFQHEETGNVMSVDAQQVDWGFEANNPRLHRVCALADYDKAQAIIDGLRGEVAAMRKRAKTAEREAASALATYKGLEKVARVVSDNSDQVCGELNVLRQQFDQHAQRIGELEGLLLRVQVSLSLDDTEWGYSGAEKYKLLADIRAALSSGKDGE